MPPAITNNLSPPMAVEGGPSPNMNEVDELKLQIVNLEKEVAYLREKFDYLEKRVDKVEVIPPLLPNEMSKLLMKEQSNISLVEDQKEDPLMLISQPSLSKTTSNNTVLNNLN